MDELNKVSDEEDPDSSEEEEQEDEKDNSDASSEFVEDPNFENFRGAMPYKKPETTTNPIENQPPPSAQPETIPIPPKSPIIEPIPPPQPQNQPPTPTQTPVDKSTVDMPSDAANSDAATTVSAAAGSDTLVSPKKQRTKRVAKKRKIDKVAEEAELDVEGVTMQEDEEVNATIATVMQGLANAAANDAAATEAAMKEKAEADQRAKEALAFVRAQKKAPVSVAGPVVADTGSVLQQSNAAAAETSDASKSSKVTSLKVYKKKQGNGSATRTSPRTKPGTPAP